MQERLQKIIARAGIASRRHAEELIKSGLVTVNGKTVTELGTKADETTDHIKVSGKLLRPETDRVHIILNKPPEVVSTMSDPEGRRALTDLLAGVSQRVFPVGRLEYHAMGLVFLTNDGDLANAILKSHHLPQTYEMKLKSLLTFQEIENFARVTGARITRLKGRDAPWYEVVISDARRDALRNRFFQTGHPVEKIKRVKLGNIALDSLQPGNHRPVSDAEISTLKKSLVDVNDAVVVAPPEPSDVSDQSLAAAPPRVAVAPSRFDRRPQVKRFFKPKPKPGQGPRQGPRPFGEHPQRSFDRPAAASGSDRAGTPRPGNSGPSFGKKPFVKKSFGADRPFRGEGSARPPKSFGSGNRPFRGPKQFGGKRDERGSRPFREGSFAGRESSGGDRPRPLGRPWKPGRPQPGGSIGKLGGLGKKTFGSDRPQGDRPSFSGNKPFREKKSFGGPKPFGGDGKPFREGKSFGGPRSEGPRGEGRPAGPGGFGKPKSFGKFGKGPKPPGARGPKRGGPGGGRPKSGGFRGPRKPS